MSTITRTRRLPVGAEVRGDGGVEFRVWAPRRHHVEVVFEAGGGIVLDRESSGYFAGSSLQAGSGILYRYRLDRGSELFPDPASRFQPDGPFGPSQVVDPQAFTWTDRNWSGLERRGQVLYEMHIGTFTPEGNWRTAAEQLEALEGLGITAIEVMPVADFPGSFGWGYDGVNLFAPTRLYGSPDDFRAFVDRAHSLGMGVILDVVYNHFGPCGNFLSHFSEEYVSDRFRSEWGSCPNFACAPVREFFTANAAYWIQEFHLDGLRLDATQSICDDSPQHILASLAEAARDAAGHRSILLIAENEPQDTRLVRSRATGGYGLDALWNDDFHHSAKVALTGRTEAYFSDYRGTPQELISAARWGFLYQGQYYQWQQKHRGTSALDLDASFFVHFLENHDQVANSLDGKRCHQLASPGRLRALTALLLLAPATPMLFQGQEFAASSPFLYFADLPDPTARQVQQGRVEFLGQFPSLSGREARASLADPGRRTTFERCRLDHSERSLRSEILMLHQDLIRLRGEDPVFRAQEARRMYGAVLGEEALVLRFRGHQEDDRLLLINLGRALALSPAPEPLLAPPPGRSWELLWHSESPRYGGRGVAPWDRAVWEIPAQAAVVLRPASEKLKR